MKATPEQLAIPPQINEADEAAEVLRVWIADGGLAVSFKTAFDDPSVWGMLLVDIARQVARGFAGDGIATEEAALRAIREMFDAEWDRPADLDTTHARQ
jgi:hypothetical protein